MNATLFTLSVSGRAPRCVIYLRVSDPGAKDKFGMDSQEAECRAYAAAMGWEVVAVYREWWTGAELFERPELAKVRQATRAGAFDVLLVHRLDRLSRDVNHQGFVLSEAEHHGIAWDSATEDLDDSPMGSILRAVIGAFAEMDRLKIIANTSRGRRAKAEKGLPGGDGKPRYGLAWRFDEDGDKIGYQEDPTTVGHLRRIWREGADGKSLGAIARGLEADGVLPPKHAQTGGTRWSRGVLRGILRDRIYLGEVVRYTIKCVKEPAAKRAGTAYHNRPRDASEHVRLPDGTAPRLVDQATFDRVQALLDERREQQWRSVDHRQTRNPEYALLRRGMALCGVCGRRLNAERRSGGYRCKGGDHERVWVRVDKLDGAAWAYLTDVLAKPERIRELAAQLRAEDPTAHDLAGLDRQRRELEAQRSSLSDAVAKLTDNPYALEGLVTRLGAVGKQLAGNDRDRAAVLARQAAWRDEIDRLDDLEARCQKIREDAAQAEKYADRRDLLRDLRITATVEAGGHWVITSGAVGDVATDLSAATRRSAGRS